MDWTNEGVLVLPQGRVERRPPARARYTLEEFQGAVGGYIEVISLRDGMLMIVNEEGKRLDLPRNELATFLAGGSLHLCDYITGSALFCPRRLID